MLVVVALDDVEEGDDNKRSRGRRRTEAERHQWADDGWGGIIGIRCRIFGGGIEFILPATVW